MRLKPIEIRDFTAGRFVVEPSCVDMPVTGLTWDSRDVMRGDLYVALPGERVDGHDFAAAAIKGGAVGVLASHALEESVLADVARGRRLRYRGARYSTRGQGPGVRLARGCCTAAWSA